MSKSKQMSLDEEARRGIQKLKELLADPTEFEKWGNQTLDMSRLRKR